MAETPRSRPTGRSRPVQPTGEAARRLPQLTDSLLELATHDAGAVEPNAAPCDLADIARETAALIQPIADERKIALHLGRVQAAVTSDTYGRTDNQFSPRTMITDTTQPP